MSAYSYVEAPNPNLTCCICRNPFVNPATTTTCSHTFCYECIFDALLHAPQCPIDRSPLTEKELGPADSIVRALVDELLVECVHHEQGCDYTCQRQLLSAHLRKECAYEDVLCTEEGCMDRVLRKDMDTHMEVNHERKVTGASNSVEAEREDTEQPPVSLSCPESRNGCPFTTTEEESLSAHVATCAYQSIKGFFSVSATRHASLLEQNVLLRHRVGALETTVQMLRREMGAVKCALGPWMRAEGSSARRNVPEGPSVISRRESVNLASQEAGDVHGEAFEERLGFPPIRAAPATPRPMYAPSNIVTVPHLSSVVAPLDLETTVEGTVNGLRESVLALAAGVDSLGRRSEIALTNESFRFGEEIMSLRASINGLRMQVSGKKRELVILGAKEGHKVHTMMMERNAQVTGMFPSITKL